MTLDIRNFPDGVQVRVVVHPGPIHTPAHLIAAKLVELIQDHYPSVIVTPEWVEDYTGVSG